MGKISIAMSDMAVCEELFQRLEQRRKARKLTQKHFAEEYLGVTVKTYRTLREGRCTMTVFLSAIRQLGLIDNLNLLLPEQGVRPTDVLKSEKRQSRGRSRASAGANVSLGIKAESSNVGRLLAQRKKLKTEQDLGGE